MCIALPMLVVEVIDVDRCLVAVEPGAGVSADRGGRDVVSAMLIADGADAVAALVGRWGLIHAGFLMEIIEAEDAASRLAVFGAMDGADGALPTMDLEARETVVHPEA